MKPLGQKREIQVFARQINLAYMAPKAQSSSPPPSDGLFVSMCVLSYLCVSVMGVM